jgi:hypothetical protein
LLRPRAHGPEDIARLLQQEEVCLLVLDTEHHMLAQSTLY